MLDRPPDVDYDDELDDAAHEWRRVRIWKEPGQVTRFVIQYETTLAGKRVAVVRYDTAHGFAHRDRFDRHGHEFDKTAIGLGLSLDAALAIAEQDLRQHWRRYRRDFFGGE